MEAELNLNINQKIDELDFGDKLNKNIQSFFTSDRFTQVIHQQLEKITVDTIQSIFDYGSDAKKKLKQFFSDKLELNLNDVDIEKYQQTIIVAINKAVNENKTLTEEAINEMISKLFAFHEKKEINFYDFIEKFKELECNEEHYTPEYIKVSIEESKYNSFYLEIKNEERNDYRILIGDDGIPFSLDVNNRKMNVRNTFFEPFEKYVISLIFNKVKILEIEEDNCDTSTSRY